MSEVYIDKYHYSNTNVKPYLNMDRFSCASGALHVAYQAFNFHYPELQIALEFMKNHKYGIKWDEMMEHAESHGFYTDFIHGFDYETLLFPLYKVPYVIIVGTTMIDDPMFKRHHCLPVRFVSSKNIGLSQIGNQGLYKLSKEEFVPMWKDYIFEHPFMTMRQEK